VRFKYLEIRDWKQFEEVKILLHPKLTILTGANGSGKTTILNLLARHFGWDFHELSTPAQDVSTGIFRFFNRFFKKPSKNEEKQIGSIEYNEGGKCTLEVPNSDSAQYSVNLNGRIAVKGLSIPSHRPLFQYQPVQQLATRKRNKIDAFNLVQNTYRSRIMGSGDKSTNYYMKETLLSWAIFGYGNQIVQPDPEQTGYYNGFREILRKVLPKTIGFIEFSIRNYEVVMVTESGDFLLDAVSGGVSAIIDLAWQIYMSSPDELAKNRSPLEEFIIQENKPEKEDFVVLIDEIENHLHATMQRSILPDFVSAFPHVQFIVSTHSPLIVGSVKDSKVYAFRHNTERRVISQELDLVDKSSPASGILRDVLGVPFTMPLWVEEKINYIVGKYSSNLSNPNALKDIRKELVSEGLESLVPSVLVKFLDESDDKNK